MHTPHQTTPRLIVKMLMMLCVAGLCFSCSEEEELSATEQEFANWQEQNERFFATLADSLTQGAGQWERFQSITSDLTANYIYVKKIERLSVYATSDELVASNDSVELSYQGKLIPSENAVLYPEGYVFDSTVYGTYDDRTNSTTKFLVSDLTDGFSTALQHMANGDHWIVYVPYQLGYGETSYGSIPAFSTLIFEITLKTHCHVGQTLPPLS